MEKFFDLQARGTTVRREFLAGLTTFLTMTYILAVIPGTLGGIGGGISSQAVFTATVLASVAATLVMAFAANLPVSLAPNVGLSAYFTYTVVFDMGYSLQAALTASLFAGILLVVISLTGVRKLIVNAIPLNLKKAITVGIGLQIALMGLKNAGVIEGDMASMAQGSITSGGSMVTIIGLLITIALYSKHVPGAIPLGMLATVIVGIPVGRTVFPESFSPFSLPAAPLFAQFDFSAVLSWEFFIIVFTLLFIDIFDTLGSLIGVTTEAGLLTTAGEGEIPRSKQAFLAGAVGTLVGAVFGSCPVSPNVESAAGVGTGGRTGLTSLFTAVFFLLALFMAPLFLIIPSFATAPAMVMAGLLLMWKITEIDFTFATEAIPAFLTIIMMPFTYNISEGIIYGILSFVLIKTLTGKAKYVPAATWILSVVFILRFILH